MIPVSAPLVSVIIPCYNYGHFLDDTLESILQQDYKHWECIIIDDGSTDNTKTIAQDFKKKDNRFIYLHQNNAGVSTARNKGLLLAKGKYIQFLDADDKLALGKLTLQVTYLDTHDDIDIVYGEAVVFDSVDTRKILSRQESTKTKHATIKRSGKGKTMVALLTYNNFIEIPTPLVRKKLLDKIGNFDSAYRWYEDWHLWFKCAVADGNFAYEPIAGTEAYIREGHASMMTHRKMFIASGIRLRKYMMQFLPPSLKTYNIYRLAKLYTRNFLNV